MLEIERKFLINGFPSGLELIREVEIEQGYLSIDPEIRIHKATDLKTGKTDFRLTMKGDGALTRTEIITDVKEDFYDGALELSGINMIKKDYKTYKLGQWILEVCHVEPETPNEFFYAEIEFPTEEDARAFLPPKISGQGNYV